MKSKTKIQTVGMALLMSIMLTGCSGKDNRTPKVNSVVTAGSKTESETPISGADKPSEMMPSSEENSAYSPVNTDADKPSVSETDLPMPSSEENSVDSPVNTDSVSINDDVMWVIGKTVDEVTEKYGSATVVRNNVYTFENGYGKYVFGDGCKTISEIPAKDLLIGDLSNVTLDNFASKCGFEVVPLNDNDNPNTMYEGYRLAYYTHPSYKDMTFSMLYKESGFDETAKFDIRYNG